MAISYKDVKRAESKRPRSGLVLAVVVAIGGLLWFAPQTTAMMEDAVRTILGLLRF